MEPEGALICLSHKRGGGAKWDWIGWDATPVILTNSFSYQPETRRFILISNITWQEFNRYYLSPIKSIA